MNTRILYLLFCLALSNHSASAKGAWELLTDGAGIGRAVNSLTVSDSGKVFAATAGKGIYRSSISGTTWSQANIGIGSDTNITAVFVDELGTVLAGASSGIIYSSDNNGDLWEQSFNSGQPSDAVNTIAPGPLGELYGGTANGNLYESIDYGFSWVEITSGAVKAGIRSVRISEFGEMFLATNGMGIYYSEDLGESWALINDGLPTAAVIDVRTIEFDLLGTIYAGVSGYGAYKSLDFGLFWEEVNNGLSNKFILSMAIDDSNNVFVGTENGVYMSSNEGGSWVEINQGGLANQKVFSLTVSGSNELYAGTESGDIYKWDPEFQEELGLVIMVEPVAEITVYPGDTATYSIDVKDLKSIPAAGAIVDISSSLDEGAQLTTNNEGKATYRLIIQKGTPPGDYEISFTAGLDEYDNSETVIRNITVEKRPYVEGDWREITNNLPDNKALAIAVTDNGDILAGIAGNGIYRSGNKGDTWSLSNSGLFANTTVVRFAESPSGEIYGATDSYGLIKSTDNGNSWTIDLIGGNSGFLSVTVSHDGVVFALSNDSDVYKSTNGGADWSEFNDGEVTGQLSYIEAGGDGYILACNSDGVLYGTKISAPQWDRRFAGLKASKVIVINATAPDGTVLAGTDDGVFASTNYGLSWSQSGTGLGGKSINFIQVAGNTYYAATESEGVWISEDRGNTWTEFNDGFDFLLTKNEIYSLHYHHSGSLYAGGFGSPAGGGLFRRDVLAVSPVGGQPGSDVLLIYPNPASQVITIDMDNSYSLPTEVSIRDMAGREMLENVDYTLAINSNNIIINITGMHRGVYFIRIRNKDVNYSGKFVNTGQKN